MPVIADYRINKNSLKLEYKKLSFSGDTKYKRFVRNMRIKSKLLKNKKAMLIQVCKVIFK